MNTGFVRRSKRICQINFALKVSYSHLSNKCGGWNKRGGGAKNGKSKNVEVEILQLKTSAFAFK